MSNITKSKARQTHVSPGIYSREIELNYANSELFTRLNPDFR